jgi:hypothetical protein
MVQYGGSYATPRLDLGAAYMEFMADESMFPEFVGLAVLPFFRSQKQAANYPALTRESMLSGADTKRAPKSAYNRVDIGGEDKAFATEEHGLEGIADDRQRSLYANDFDLDLAVTRQVMRKVRLAHELRVKEAVFDTGTWTGAALTTDVSAAPWSNAASPVVKHVLAAKEKVRVGTGMEPNALILGRAQFENLLNNAEILARFPGAALVTEAMIRQALASIFGLSKLIIGNAVQNTADEGQAASIADVWGSTYAMVAKVAGPNDSIEQPSIGRTVLWVPESPEEIVVESYREEQVRGDVIRCRHDVDEIIQSPELGHLLKIA